jgi:flavin reductase (DIM6/NTAB) family NADH-FMN oxidoreductase RutF
MDEKAKKTALRMIPYGLFLLGCGKGARATAATINWITQTSFEPPLVALGVKQGTAGLDRIRSDKQFAVSVLGTGQKDMAFAFFKHVEPEGNKLGGHFFETRSTGCPIFSDVPAWWECELVQVVDGGDHAIVIGRVIEAGVNRQQDPLTLKECGVNYGG